jgi:membrane protein DedA with SNARE-associated domain/rhodanese-related sulfurtransferase
MISSSQLTYTGVLVAVFANQLCLPIPSVVVLMAAGALSAEGKMQLGMVVFLSVSACMLADTTWFWLGRHWGSNALRLLCRFTADPRSCSTRAHEKFCRHGLGLLSVAKFLPGLDGLMPPLAGAEGVSLPRFLAIDLAGAFLWSAFYVALGYAFSNQLEIAIGWAAHFATTLALAIGVPIALYAGWRGLILVRMLRRLALRRISPRMLARKLKSKRKVAVVDLLNFEDEAVSENIEAIPGAFRLDPSRLRKSPHIIVPDDVEIILYCSSQRDMVSVRAAVALKRIGINNVWALEGGLRAWLEQGFPVSRSLESPEIVAQRYGIKMPPRSPGVNGHIEGTPHDNNGSSRNGSSEITSGCKWLTAGFGIAAAVWLWADSLRGN